MPFVLDNSVAMAWCFEDESSPYADRVLDLLRQDVAHAPAIWPLEVGNALAGATRRGRLPAARARALASQFLALPIVLHQADLGPELGPVLALALDEGLTSYDAAYLELALRSGMPLATQDKRLRGAADRLGVQPLV